MVRSIGRSRRRRGKYGAIPAAYLGRLYDSTLERDVAAHLDLLQKGGLIRSWSPKGPDETQPSWVLLPQRRGQRKTATRPFIPTLRQVIYTSDFLVRLRDGRERALEVKGVATAVFNLRYRLFQHVYPDVECRIVRSVEEVLAAVS